MNNIRVGGMRPLQTQTTASVSQSLKDNLSTRECKRIESLQKCARNPGERMYHLIPHNRKTRSRDTPITVEDVYANREAHKGPAKTDSLQRRLEIKENEVQTTVVQELDASRSSGWSFMHENNYHLEEQQKLNERLRELEQQNALLQREVSSLNVREVVNKNKLTNSEEQIKNLTVKLEEATQESLSRLQSYKDTKEESKELQKTVSRLHRTCSEQERTIKGLREVLAEEPSDYWANKWKMEQVRLTEIEQVLRRKVESNRLEVEALRRENVNLLDRLNNSGIEGGSAGFRLEHELKDRILCLQKQGLSLSGESCKLCEKLLRFIKGKTDQSAWKNKQVEKDEFDGCFVLEAEGKVEYMKTGIDNLRRSLQSISLVLEEKSKRDPLNTCTGNGTLGTAYQDEIASKLKAETLLTTLLRQNLLSKQEEVEQLQAEVATTARVHDLLREKLLSKEQEVKQSQAEMAAAARVHDILRSKFRGSLDPLFGEPNNKNEKMKRFDSIHNLTSELRRCEKELASTVGVLSKITKERDKYFKKAEKENEMKILLEHELDTSRKKVASLEEDLHAKEGQMILRDILRNRELASTEGVLSKITKERDKYFKKAEKENEMNMLLERELDTSRKNVETLEVDLHVKEGQIEILRDILRNRTPFDIPL